MGRRWQFTLSSLMIAMAGLSVAAALIARFGAYAIILLGLCSLLVGLAGRAHGSGAVATAGFCGFVVALVGMIPCVQVAVWDGQKTIPLRFTLLDSANGKPIAGAMARLRQNCGWLPQTPQSPDQSVVVGNTASDGSVALPWTFWTSGREGYFEHTGQIYFSPACLWIEVSAPGYATQLIPLESLTGKSRDVSDPIPPPITISLLRTPSKVTAPSGPTHR